MNPNSFLCSLCSAGIPFAGKTGLPNSTSQVGDKAWVQFIYQYYNFTNSQNTPYGRVCAYNWDLTVFDATYIAGDQKSYYGFTRNCYGFTSPVPAPLTGPGSVMADYEVAGYEVCPNSNSASGCVLQALANVPVIGWYSASIADVVGLSGQWTNVSGSILGFSGSQANFTHMQYEQALAATSCFEQNVQSGLSIPTVCTLATLPSLPRGPVLLAPRDQFLILSAINTPLPVTAETNNLVSASPVMDCRKLYECFLSALVTAP